MQKIGWTINSFFLILPGLKKSFTLDVITRGHSTTIFLCIGPFSAWSRTNKQPGDPRASLLLTSVRRQSFAISIQWQLDHITYSQACCHQWVHTLKDMNAPCMANIFFYSPFQSVPSHVNLEVTPPIFWSKLNDNQREQDSMLWRQSRDDESLQIE